MLLLLLLLRPFRRREADIETTEVAAAEACSCATSNMIDHNVVRRKERRENGTNIATERASQYAAAIDSVSG